MSIKKNYNNYRKKLLKEKGSLRYILIILTINLIMWYIFFRNELKLNELFVLSFVTTLLVNEIVGIVTNAEHARIPAHYSAGATILMRVFILSIVIFALVASMNICGIIHLW